MSAMCHKSPSNGASLTCGCHGSASSPPPPLLRPIVIFLLNGRINVLADVSIRRPAGRWRKPFTIFHSQRTRWLQPPSLPLVPFCTIQTKGEKTSQSEEMTGGDCNVSCLLCGGQTCQACCLGRREKKNVPAQTWTTTRVNHGAFLRRLDAF